jgi:hypothetical protein
MERIRPPPARYGFPLPAPGYLTRVKRLCERYGALYPSEGAERSGVSPGRRAGERTAGSTGSSHG